MLQLIKFSANWCGPCKVLKPIWENLVKTNKDVVFTSVDIDDDPDSATKYKIQAVPTIIFVKDGVELDRVVGMTKESFLKTKIDAYK